MMISCCLRRVVLLATIVVSLFIVAEAAVTIDAYPSTQPVPLGTTVVLVCRVVGVSEESSSASYQWSCPNGACDISRGTQVPPRSRIVSGNTLTVNVVSKSDSGEYRCTVSEGGTTQTSSYNMTVSGGIALYTLVARQPVRVFQSNSVISNPDDVKAGFFKVSISCVGDDSSAVGQWRGPDGSPISANFFGPTYQRDGRLLISRLNRQYSNGNYKCKIGDEEAVIGLYFTSGSLVGTYSGNISNFRATMISSSTTRLSWNALTNPDPSTTTTVGYFVSYGRVDHGVKENIVVNGSSNTNVLLSNLDSGVEYEATIRGFSEDGTDRRVSTPVASVRWTTVFASASSTKSEGSVSLTVLSLSVTHSSPAYQAPSPTSQAPLSSTSQTTSSLMSQAPSSPTSQAPSSPTSQAPSSPTSQAPSSPTSQASSSPTSQAPLSPTSQTTSSPTSQTPSLSTPQAQLSSMSLVTSSPPVQPSPTSTPEASAIVGGIIGALVLLLVVISLVIAIIVFTFICAVRKQAHRVELKSEVNGKYTDINDSEM